jgi:PAS domain S-box-containing protein
MLQQLQVNGAPPAIVLASLGAEFHALQAIRRGARDALVQPFLPEQAAEAIARVLQQERLAKERDWLIRKLAADNEALEKSLSDAQTLQDVSISLSTNVNLTDVLESVVQTAVSLTQADEGYVLLRHPKDNTILLRALQERGKAEVQDLCVPVKDTFASHVLRTGEPVFLSSDDDAYISIISGPRSAKTGRLVRSLINVPLQYQGHTIGVLGVHLLDTHYNLAQADVMLLSDLAKLAGIAIKHVQRHSEGLQKLSDALAEVSCAQHKADLILQCVSDGIYTIDTDFRLTCANPALEHITGWQMSELLGRRFDEVFAPQTQGRKLFPNETTPGRALYTQSKDTPLRTTILHKDGHRIPVTGTASPLRAADASIIGVLGTMRPVTTGPSSSDALPFQNPQFDLLIEDTLDTLHLETGTASSRCHPVTLGPIIKQAIKHFEDSAPNTSFRVALSPDLSFAIGNESKIELALVNLIESALVASDPRKPIVISTSAQDDHIAITVQGSGPTASTRKREMPQSESSTDAQNTQDGYPLSWWATPQIKFFIARKLIQAQGGQIRSENRPGTSICFQISLPKVEVKDVAQAFTD